MEIITSHTNTDLDALASMVGASKLYPGAVMVFPGKLTRAVEEFLALYKDILNVKTFKEIAGLPVKRVILVDTSSLGRVADVAEIVTKPGVDVHIYDHHPKGDGDVAGSLEVIDAVGAAATLLVEKIIEKGIELSPLEATILALGIYEDTGSLVFSSTTPRDAAAVAYLLGRGANLSVVADFLGRPLTDEQRELLKALLVSAERHQVNGIDFLIARANIDEFVSGLALLTHKLADFAQLDAVFTVVEMEERVYVVARSAVPEMNVREVLSVFGGGGHAMAASATLKKARLDEVVEKLLSAVREKCRPPLTAADIMSCPVKTVSPQMVIEEAGKVMLRYGHSGLPVVDGGRLVGIVSRRDVEKALHHGLGHAPVKGFMSTNLVTVSPQTPAAAVRELMIEYDIGRLPVLDGDRLVGIVSRTDVLRTLHGEVKTRHRLLFAGEDGGKKGENISGLLARSLDGGYMEILKRAGELASELGFKLYGAGGIVRDALLGAECLDVDLVVEGDAIELARAIAKEYGAKLRQHPKFCTATVIFSGGRQIDLATARIEFYQYPAAMPQVEVSTLHQDLYRRDFTINAMAVSLNKGDDFGRVIDFFGGREDLERGLVRVLHNLSFVEDPTRLLRAVKFEVRYRMSLEPQTLQLALEAVRANMLARVSAARIWEELKSILGEPRAGRALMRLKELGLWEFLFPGVAAEGQDAVLAEIPRSIKTLLSWDFEDTGERWLVYLTAVLCRSSREAVLGVCRHYCLGKRYIERLSAAHAGWRAAAESFCRANDPLNVSELAAKLIALPKESYPLVLAHLTGSASRERFRRVLTAVYYDKPSINGKDLRAMGLKPGPVYKLVLDAVWRARLDGRVRTREEELSFAREYISKMGEV